MPFSMLLGHHKETGERRAGVDKLPARRLAAAERLPVCVVVAGGGGEHHFRPIF